MAELTAPTSSCCAPEAQETCCEPNDKDVCCGTSAAGGSCGCSASQATEQPDPVRVRERVRDRYATAAKAAAEGASFEGGSATSNCCGRDMSPEDEHGDVVFGGTLYEDEAEGAPRAAVEASLGCRVPTAVADLHPGETVLDLGSGAGADVLISARRVGVTGKAIGLDMTDEMLELARGNARDAGVDNVDFVNGYIEDIPLADDSVDVVISNCVINLSADKGKALREVARVLRPGGRFAVSDVIADDNMDAETRSDMEQWTGCVAGALTRGQFEAALSDAGLVDLEIRETHRVHEHASSAIVSAKRGARRSSAIRRP